MARSYWMNMCCDSDRDRKALLSWFAPLCDGMTPLDAKVLCDEETDREKKLKVTMKDEDGNKIIATRSKTRAGWSIKLQKVQK